MRKNEFKSLLLAHCEIDVTALHEDIRLEECFWGGALEQDLKNRNNILEDLNNGNNWAWCCARISINFFGEVFSEYLSECSFKDSQDFITNSGYYEDMLDSLVDQVIDYIEKYDLTRFMSEYCRLRDNTL